MTFRDFIKLLTPPLLVQAGLRLANILRPQPAPSVSGSSARPEWEYIPEGWAYPRTHPEVKGWNVQGVLETYKQKWPQFVRMVQGTGPLGVAHESALTTNEDIYSHNTILTFAYTLALAARQKDRLSMLDWGGGIGHYYLLAQALLPDVEIEYHCKDVPLLAEHGASLFPDAHFYTDDACLKRSYDFVLASTSLQYSEDWRTLAQNLTGASSAYLYIANLPTVKQAPSFVFVQRPYQYGYNTEYLAWCLNYAEFLHIMEQAGLHLLREFVYGHQPFIHHAPEQNIYRGYLFQTRPEEKHEPRNR